MKAPRFLGFRFQRPSFGTSLFVVFGAVALALAGPRLAAGFRQAAPALPAFQPVVGPVTRIIDGDTFLIGTRKIRLWGIDAPEAATPNGPAATEYLARVVANHPLTCRQAGPPSHDRMVARCLDPWGRDIAEIMVGAGWALDWPEFSKGQYRAAQARAAAQGAGSHGIRADGVFYPGCREAEAAGAAPLHRGQPGYGAHMDGDGDGIACEPQARNAAGT